MRKTLTVVLLVSVGLVAVAQETTTQILRTAYQESAPKYFIDNGATTGLCIDIISALNNLLAEDQVAIEPRDSSSPFLPFARLTEQLEAGDIDVFVGLAKNEERLQAFRFTDEPAYAVRSTFAKLSTSPFEYRAPEDLVGRTVAVVTGSKTGAQMEALTGVDVVGVSTLDQAVRMLSAERVDLVFYHSLGLGFTIRQLGLDGLLSFTQGAYEDYAHYVAFNRSVPESIVQRIGSALNELLAEGRIEAIVSKYIAH